MAVSPDDRRRMDRLGRALAAVETDEEPRASATRAAIDQANRRRARRGLPPIVDRPERPEEEFYRRARALGFRRSRG